MNRECFALLFLSPFTFPSAAPVTMTVAADSGLGAISPWIYGTNQDLTGTEGWTFRRMGGNRMTGYNWENNASHAGTDWNNESDNHIPWAMGLPSNRANEAGLAVTAFHDSALSKGWGSLLTLPCAGFVARDKNGAVAESETAPSRRWAAVVNRKGAPFALRPDTTDSLVFVDELLNLLQTRYGGAAGGRGVPCYALDNEPALWPSTHPRIHPAKTRAREVADRNIALAQTIKAIDSTARVFGPVLYGFNAYLNCQDAPDWDSVRTGYRWFINYYLARMRAASQAQGRRLLDVLDLHWYAEGTVRGTPDARMQAPRTLWDPNYREDSWIAQWFSSYLPLIPNLLKAIDTFYPGTKLAFTEYNYGGENHVSGGLATADALGIFGQQGVYAACYWQMESATSYTTAAFRLFRNADSRGLAFGTRALLARTADSSKYSLYASDLPGNPGELHLVALNKRRDSAVTADFTLPGTRSFRTGRVFGFDSTSAEVSERAPVTAITGNRFSYVLPPLSAFHFSLYASGSQAQQGRARAASPWVGIFPMPFTGSGRIEWSLPGAEGRLEILAVDGRVVRSYGKVSDRGSKSITMKRADGSFWPQGLYLIRLTSGNQTVVKLLGLVR